MAVVVGAPYVDEGGEAAVKLVLVVGDVRREIGRVAVLADKNVVLELEVVDVFLCLALTQKLLCEDFLVLVPNRAVELVGQTLGGQLVNDSLDSAALVERPPASF